MQETVFIDSDLLFRYFAISKEKQEFYIKNGTTGIEILDVTIELINSLESKNQYLIISEFSLLELICILNRLESAYKIPRVLERLHFTSDILPLNENILLLAQFLGANFKLHTGDAIHASFCLLNDIEIVFLSDSAFYSVFQAIQQDYNENGTDSIEKYYNTLAPAQYVPSALLKKYANLGHLEIHQV